MSIDDQPLTVGEFRRFMAEHEDRAREMKSAILADAFPGGELLPHKAFHQSKIDAAKAEKEFWEAAKVEVFKRGLSGVMYALWMVVCLALLGLSVKLGAPIPFIGKIP